MHIEQTLVLKASREQVFRAFTDYEAVPKWQSLFTRVTVTKRDGNKVELDTDVNFRGRTAKRIEKHVLMPPQQILVEGEMEGITNSTVWKFEPIPEGTRLEVVLDARLPWKFRVLGPLAKRQFQALLRNWLQELAEYVEAK